MKPMMKLTQVPHPEVSGGKAGAVFVDPMLICSIELGKIGYGREQVYEQYRKLTYVVDQRMKELAEMLSTNGGGSKGEAVLLQRACQAYFDAVRLHNSAGRDYEFHYPRVDCTLVKYRMSGNAGEGTLFVTETPDEVYERMRWPTIPSPAPGTLLVWAKLDGEQHYTWVHAVHGERT